MREDLQIKILKAKKHNIENELDKSLWKSLKVHVWKEWSEEDPRYLEYLKRREELRKEHDEVKRKLAKLNVKDF